MNQKIAIYQATTYLMGKLYKSVLRQPDYFQKGNQLIMQPCSIGFSNYPFFGLILSRQKYLYDLYPSGMAKRINMQSYKISIFTSLLAPWKSVFLPPLDALTNLGEKFLPITNI